MKIRDIITEAPGILAGVKQDYNKGYDAVDKILNPKRWGEVDKGSSKTSAATPLVDKLDLRDSLNLVVAGKPLSNQNVATLKQAHPQIKSGKLEIRQDVVQTLIAIKTAIAMQKLTPQQQQLLTAVVKDL